METLVLAQEGRMVTSSSANPIPRKFNQRVRFNLKITDTKLGIEGDRDLTQGNCAQRTAGAAEGRASGSTLDWPVWKTESQLGGTTI